MHPSVLHPVSWLTGLCDAPHEGGLSLRAEALICGAPCEGVGGLANFSHCP